MSSKGGVISQLLKMPVGSKDDLDLTFIAAQLALLANFLEEKSKKSGKATNAATGQIWKGNFSPQGNTKYDEYMRDLGTA